MGDIDTQINSISTAVDLSSFKVLTPDMNTALNDFKNSGISNIDFAAINTTVQALFCLHLKIHNIFIIIFGITFARIFGNLFCLPYQYLVKITLKWHM